MDHGEGRRKGKGKRKKLEDGDICGGIQLPLEENQICSTASYEGAAQSIYVVVNIHDTCRAFSLYKLDYPHSCSDGSPKRLHRLARLEDPGGKTFVSVQTQHRKWIVAVGGTTKGRQTIVFDTKTKELIHGPDLGNAKDCPVLVSLEDKIYAISSWPQVTGKLDFEPWFEVLDLSQAKVVDGHLEDCSWKELPNPPCFPCEITLIELSYPPMVSVQSYAVVGSYILLSLRKSNSGTYAFNTICGKWQQVDSKNLPFMGRATPHGAGGVYLGMSAQERPGISQENPAAVSAYCIKLSPNKHARLTTSEKHNNPAMKLSVTEFPIKSDTDQVVTGVYFSSLDRGSFCSLNWQCCKPIRSRRDEVPDHVPSDDEMACDDDIIVQFPKKAYINLEMYQMENSVLQETEQILPPTMHRIAISKQQKQSFKIRTKSGGFISPAFTTVFNTY